MRSVVLPAFSGLAPGLITSQQADAAQTTAFLARTSGLSATERNAYRNLINGLVADGVWPLLDILYIFATNTQTTALLNLVGTNYTGTTHGTVSFTADQGYTGDGSTFYIDTGFACATAGGNFALNSAHMSAYSLSSVGPGSTTVCGLYDGTNITDIINFAIGSNMTTRINSTAGFNQSDSSSAGYFIASRTASNVEASYINAGAGTADGSASTAIPTGNNMYVFNRSGPISAFSPNQLSAFSCGAGLTAAQVSSLQTRVNNYMKALGINVY